MFQQQSQHDFQKEPKVTEAHQGCQGDTMMFGKKNSVVELASIGSPPTK